jgi:hypothetical protein
VRKIDFSKIAGALFKKMAHGDGTFSPKFNILLTHFD